jgi:hypothetical protein
MITLVALPLILAFAPGAVWALRAGGLRRLWLLCGLAILAGLLAALLLSAVYSVPGTWRVIYYFLTLVGPSLLCAAGSLTVANTLAKTLPIQLISAFAGSLTGLAMGFAAVVYLLGLW